MNSKQFMILVIVALLVGGLGYYLYKRDSASWASGGGSLGQKVIPDFPLNDVQHVRIKSGAGEVNLVFTNEQWRVAERWNYPANFGEIRDFLRKVWELKAVEKVQVGPSQFGRLELLPPEQGTNKTGTLVQFKGKEGKEVASLLLGKKQMRSSEGGSSFGGGEFPEGRYVMTGDKDVWLLSDPFSSIETDPKNWLNKDFIKVENPRTVSVTSTNATNSFVLTRESQSGTWTLAEKQPGEEVDSSKTSSFNYVLSSPSFNDLVAPDAHPSETGLDTPAVSKIETFDNFTYTVRVGNKTADDNYHLQVSVDAALAKERTPAADEKPEDKEKLDKEFKEKLTKLEEKLKESKAYENWTYLVSKWTIDTLLKERKDLLADKKDEKKDEGAAASPTTNGAPGPSGPLNFEIPQPPVLPALPAKPAEAPKGPDIPATPPPRAEPKPESAPAPEAKPAPEAQPESKPQPETAPDTKPPTP